jgi:hypothetical protein
LSSRPDLRDSVERTREAFRRSNAPEAPEGLGAQWLPPQEQEAPQHEPRGGEELAEEASQHEPRGGEELAEEAMRRGDEPGGGQEVPSGLHPFFRGLLEALPDPGADWPPAKRDQWLETARNIFALMYKDSAAGREPAPLREVVQHPSKTAYGLDQRTA